MIRLGRKTCRYQKSGGIWTEAEAAAPLLATVPEETWRAAFPTSGTRHVSGTPPMIKPRPWMSRVVFVASLLNP